MKTKTETTIDLLDRLMWADGGEFTREVAIAAESAGISASNALLEIDCEIEDREDFGAWVAILETTREMVDWIHGMCFVGDLGLAAAGACDLATWLEGEVRDFVADHDLGHDEGAECVVINCRTVLEAVAYARALEVGVEI